MIEKEALRFKDLEHVLMEKVEQLWGSCFRTVWQHLGRVTQPVLQKENVVDATGR